MKYKLGIIIAFASPISPAYSLTAEEYRSFIAAPKRKLSEAKYALCVAPQEKWYDIQDNKT